VLIAGVFANGCSKNTKASDVKADIRNSLKQAGLTDVSVDQDRDKGVITLNGHVPTESDKANAQSIARTYAGSQVVANQIEVRPAGAESATKTIDSDLDKGIEKNLDAALIKNGLRNDVKYSVKNSVVTLTGNVNSETLRQTAQHVAAAVPNVSQVVNEIELRNQRATSTR